MATHALYLREIINQTLRMAGDYFGTGYPGGKTWTRAKVAAAVNQALLEWARKTGFLRGVDTVALTEDTKTYTLPDDCLRLLRIGFYDGNASTWISRPTVLTDHDLAYLSLTGDSYPFYHFLEYLAYNKFGFQPAVGEDITAYLSYARPHTYLTYEAWNITDDDISFDAGTKQIRSASAAFNVDAFPEDATVTISGSTNNDSDYTVSSTATTTSVITVDEALVNEAAGADVTVTSDREGVVYPEDGIPTWFHKDIKYGASKILLAESREPWRKFKKKYCEAKWNRINERMTVVAQYHGHDHGVYPE